jgi:hypothetical protein
MTSAFQWHVHVWCRPFNDLYMYDVCLSMACTCMTSAFQSTEVCAKFFRCWSSCTKYIMYCFQDSWYRVFDEGWKWTSWRAVDGLLKWSNEEFHRKMLQGRRLLFLGLQTRLPGFSGFPNKNKIGIFWKGLLPFILRFLFVICGKTVNSFWGNKYPDWGGSAWLLNVLKWLIHDTRKFPNVNRIRILPTKFAFKDHFIVKMLTLY